VSYPPPTLPPQLTPPSSHFNTLMRDWNPKVRERSPSAGEPIVTKSNLEVSEDRSPSRNKRVKKHHCHQQKNSNGRREECTGHESGGATGAHESQRVTCTVSMSSLSEGNNNMTNVSKAQMGKREANKDKTTRGAGLRAKKQLKAKKARKAAVEREAAKIVTAKAAMEQLLDPKSHVDETAENRVQKRPKGEERKARKQANRRKRKEAQKHRQQQQDHAAMVGAADGYTIQDEAEQQQSSVVPSEDSEGLRREKRAVAGMQSEVPAGLVTNEDSLYPSPAVGGASTQAPDIALSSRRIYPASVDDNSSCSGFKIVESPMVHGVEGAARRGLFSTTDGPTGVTQAGVQNQGGMSYEFPGPGAKHWCKLTLEQRMAKIDLNPVGSDHRRKRSIWAKVEGGPVYASIVDLPRSSEVLDMLIHWLRSRIVSGVPATDFGDTLLAHTWKLLEFVLRDNVDKLEEIKTNFRYARRLAPRIQKWEKVQLTTEKTCTEIESLWGKSWKEECARETHTAGVRSFEWERSIVKKVKVLASTAMERGIGRENAWGLVLKEVLAKGERAAVVAEDVWVVTETLIEM